MGEMTRSASALPDFDHWWALTERLERYEDYYIDVIGDCGHPIYKVAPAFGIDGHQPVVIPRPSQISHKDFRDVSPFKTFAKADPNSNATQRQRYGCPRRGCGFVRIAKAERVAEAYLLAVEAGRTSIVAGVDF